MSEQTLVIAHRGASRQFRENTLEAFDRAIQCGADAVEFDVQQTNDGVLVVYHDDFLPCRSRTPISVLSYNEVLAFMAQFNVHVPRLVDVLYLCRNRIFCDVDVKDSASMESSVETCLDFLKVEDFQIKSFHADRVHLVKNLDARIQTALLVGLPSPKRPVRTRLGELFPVKRLEQCGADQIHAHYKLLRLNFLKRMAKAQKPVWVWTVDDIESLVAHIDDPLISGVITNEPALALRLRAEVSESVTEVEGQF